MRIEIDRELCLESGQCAYLQPSVFELDEAGQPHVRSSSDAGDANSDRRKMVEEAVDICPSQAISIVEDDDPA